jgi:hypothetical protein
VLELVRVDHGANHLHLAVGDVDRENAGHAAVGVVGHRARLAVDQGRHGVGPVLLRPAVQPEQEPGDPLRPVRGLAQGLTLAAAVADHDHVGGEELQQAAEVASPGRLEEAAGHLVALLS